MTISIIDFDLDKEYADDTILTEDQLDAGLIDTGDESVESYINTYIKNNLLQLTKDCFPDNVYEFDDDGLGNMTNTLFDKQIEEETYDSGDFSIDTSIDVDWEDVDAINCYISFTPEARGKYKATCQFTHTFTFTENDEISVTVTHAADLFTATAHGLVNGDTVLVTGSTMPTGLVAGVTYYVVNKTDDTFQLSATSGGAAINVTGDGVDVSVIKTTPVSLLTRFRITDSTTASQIILSGATMSQMIGGTPTVVAPISVFCYFNWSDANERIIKLQKRNMTCEDVATNIVGGSTTNGVIHWLVEKV